jgi:predicted HTH transcriptional regulator
MIMTTIMISTNVKPVCEKRVLIRFTASLPTLRPKRKQFVGQNDFCTQIVEGGRPLRPTSASEELPTNWWPGGHFPVVRDLDFIHISLDHVEIISPGGLVSGLKLADLGRVSIPRNPLLFALMHRMDLVEDVGSGIRRIRDEMKNYGLEKPLIEIGEAWFSMTLKRKSQDSAIEPQRGAEGVTPSVGRSNEGVNEGVEDGDRLVEKVGSRLVERLAETQRKIIELMSKTPAISKRELAADIGISTTAIDKNIAALKSKGLLRRIGPDKGGHWTVMKRDNP